MIITGNRGFIGSHLSKKVDAIGIDIKDGYDVISCVLPPSDVIYHLAAQTSVEESWNDPVKDSDNLKMIVRLVKENPNSRIIYTNSAASLNPESSPYAFSKWACAEYLKRFHKNYVICTLPNIFGEGSHSVVQTFASQKIATIYGDGTHVRDYVSVDDIVDGLLKAQNWPVGEYQLGSGKGTSTLDVAFITGHTTDTIQFLPERKEAKESILQNNTPDWEPTHGI